MDLKTWKKTDEYKETAESVWDGAQKALLADPMIVDLREVWKDAPEWATDIQLWHGNEEGGRSHFKTIPRPAPAWIPKVGDLVFVRSPIMHNYHYVGIHREWKGLSDDHLAVDYNGTTMNERKIDIKPFNINHITKKWEDIPAAPKEGL